MIKINLKYATGAAPIEAVSHAAKMCYQAEPPVWGETMNVEKALFKTGHHTTLQHFFLTFEIDAIAVGDITFGLHLASPFYNSDQRSGRFCGQMFSDPDFKAIENYIRAYWSGIEAAGLKKVMAYVERGVEIYQSNLDEAAKKAEEFIRAERPKAKEKYILRNAPKIAQEQMRMFVPVIFPTGLVFTLNLSALAALFESAWNPVLRSVTGEMARLVMEKYPELKFIFREEHRRQNDWSPLFSGIGTALKDPKLELLNFYSPLDFKRPEPQIVHPVDRLHFTPEMMDNTVAEITAKVDLSVATMGQDQRHRTIRRGAPAFTGNFYLPPILDSLGLAKEAEEILSAWSSLRGIVPDTLHTVLTPYGAMVSYIKAGSLNAVLHEQGKRLCWCAQEEIYHLGRSLREALAKEEKAKEFRKLLEPPCFCHGVCAEGRRYCGRDISLRETGEYFPKRKV